jgi:hypothetical protein
MVYVVRYHYAYTRSALSFSRSARCDALRVSKIPVAHGGGALRLSRYQWRGSGSVGACATGNKNRCATGSCFPSSGVWGLKPHDRDNLITEVCLIRLRLCFSSLELLGP